MSRAHKGKVPGRRALKRKSRRARPALPLAGAKKKDAIATVANQAGKASLAVRRVLSVGVDEVADGIGLVIREATVIRDFGTNDAVTARVATDGNVRIIIDGVVGATYLFDCGVSGATRFDFFVFENGAGSFVGNSVASGGRLLFAHAYTAQQPNFLAVTMSSDKAFTFASCEVTELADSRPTIASQPGPAKAIAR